MSKNTVGVLALQGDFQKHLQMLQRIGVKCLPVRTRSDFEQADALIIPGGESTTVGILLKRGGLADAIRERAASGMPLWGTCMGLILLASNVENSYKEQFSLQLLDVTVRRNAFGRQLQSFEAPLLVPAIGDEPLRGVFIRAPAITDLQNAERLAEIDGLAVACRQNHILGTCFHPELTDDERVHRYFLEML